MLSPEVWSFSPPKTEKSLVVDLSEEKITKQLLENPFYHNIFLIFADTSKDIPNQIKDTFKDGIYYKLSNIPLSELFERDFLDGYVKKGSVSCLSIDIDTNFDNIISITDSRDFNLILNADSYHRFGINGKKLKRKSTEFSFHINFSLSENQLSSGTKLHKRVYERSKQLNDLTLVISWEPFDNSICPSSIAKYFDSRGITVEECEPSLALRKQHVSLIPLLDVKNVNSVIEWIGMIAVNGEVNPDEDFVSKYTVGCAAIQGFVTAFNINGFFTSNFIIKLLKKLRKNMDGMDICKWYGLSLQTFTDAPKNKWLSENKCVPQDDIISLLYNDKNNILSKCLRLY